MTNKTRNTVAGPDRRDFLKAGSVAAVATVGMPYFLANPSLVAGTIVGDRPKMGCIGTGSRWGAVGPNAMAFADCVAVCDVDANHAQNAAKTVEDRQGKRPDIYEDYRKVLERDDITVVTIVTTDHWHSKIAVEAMQAGKDVYCEKPLTLTIEEGKQICKVAKETGRVFQVGTQQRSEMGQMFLKAVALVRDGRIGDVTKVTCAIGGAPTSPSLPVVEIPAGLNWEMWLGQAPKVDYRKMGGSSRCHYEFRWWYEYSGGKMTDWGAHHIDIAQWAINQNGDNQGALEVNPLEVTHPVEFKDGYPTDDSMYNTATQFNVHCKMTGGANLFIRHDAKDMGFDNGIFFEGTKGQFLVNRGKLVGEPVDELKENPLPDALLKELYNGKTPEGNNAHMKNFFDCIADRGLPVSDVFSHHRALTTCHLANIAIRLNRKLKWDPVAQQMVGDDQANQWQSRQQREGYQINVEV